MRVIRHHLRLRVRIGPRSRWTAPGWPGKLAEDDKFRSVLVIWALCCLAQALYIKAYGASLPWADEWQLTAAASGHEHLTWEWLWRPANEHRAPLTRLAVFVLARLGSSDWQVTHFVGLIFMALGALALLVAAREARGRTTLSDAFLCLLVLSPWHFASLMVYGYAYAIATGLLCLAISLASSRWPLRSVSNLALYLLLALAVTLSAGPAGNLWAIGLCGVVVLALFERTSRLWKISGLLGTTIVTAVSVTMLLAIPKVPIHEEYHSQSVRQTLTAGAKIAMGWMGAPPFEVLWPWALVLHPGARPVRAPASRQGRRQDVETGSRRADRFAAMVGSRSGAVVGLASPSGDGLWSRKVSLTVGITLSHAHPADRDPDLFTHGATACPRGHPSDARPGDGRVCRLVLAESHRHRQGALSPAGGTEENAPARHHALECRLDQVLPALDRGPRAGA